MTTRDENHICDARSSGFLNRILNKRLIYYGEHFFRHRLSSRKETGAKARDREYGFSYRFHIGIRFTQLS